MAIEQQFNQNDEEKDPSQPAQTGAGASASVTSPGTGSSVNAPKRQGSGRFVNLQKYLGANEGAGQRLGSGIGQKVEQGFGAEREKSGTEQTALQQAFGKGQESIQSGQALKGSLGDAGFNASTFAANKANVENVAKLRQGLALDEKELFDRQSQFSQMQNQAAQNVNKRLGQVGTEEGRFGLLKEAYGGGTAAPKRYGTGQQRLDQLFLQAGAGDQVKQLQQGVQSRQAEVSKQQALADKYGTDIKSLAEQEAALGQEVGGLVTNKFQQEQDRQQKQMEMFNAERAKQAQDFRTNFQGLTDNNADTTVNDSFLSSLGLAPGMRTYGALRNLSESDIASINDRLATNIGESSSAEEIANINALAQLSGSYYDPTAAQLQYTGPSYEKTDLGGVVDLKQGDDSLQSRINKGKQSFQDYLNRGEVIEGSGNWGGAGAFESQKLQDYLMSADNISRINTSNPAYFGGSNATKGLFGINTGGGISQENYTQAEALAAQDRVNRMNALLDQYGYSDLVSGTGVTKDFTPEKNSSKRFEKITRG